jgi:hypothetical protein
MDKHQSEVSYKKARAGQWEGQPEQFFELFEVVGYELVRADIDSGWISPVGMRSAALTWVGRHERKERADLLAAEDVRSQASLRAAGDAARWAMWAALISLATVAAQVIGKWSGFF